jgi:putative MATE family efflux protein
MVDMIIVGHALGKTGISAVSVGGDIANFLTFIAMGFSNAGSVIISKYIGANKRGLIGRFILNMFMLLFGIAVVFGAGCLIFIDGLLALMNTPVEAEGQAFGYAVVSICGMVFIFGYNAISAVLRGLGDSKHPFVFISIAALLNIFLDLIFVIVLPLGAAGAALATVISQCVSFLSCLIFLYYRRSSLGFSLNLSDLKSPDKSMLLDLTKLGIPMAIKSASIHFSKLFVNSWINSYGVAVSAFAGITNKISSVSNLISNSLNTAGSSMVGQNIGAKRYERVPKICLTITGITMIIATVLSIAFYAFPEAIFGIFTTDPAVLVIGAEYLPIAVLIFFGSACRSPANALVNGSGNYKVNFATAIFDGIILRIGLSILFGITFDMGYLGFWLGDALAGFTPMFIGIVFYLTGTWKEKKPA